MGLLLKQPTIPVCTCLLPLQVPRMYLPLLSPGCTCFLSEHRRPMFCIPWDTAVLMLVMLPFLPPQGRLLPISRLSLGASFSGPLREPSLGYLAVQ